MPLQPKAIHAEASHSVINIKKKGRCFAFAVNSSNLVTKKL